MGDRDDEYWAAFLGVRASDWMGSGVVFRSHAGLRGYRGLWCFRRGERVVVSAPPGWVARLEARWARWGHERLLDAAAVAESLGEACERCIGPAFQGCLDPESFRERAAPRVRAIQPSDRDAIERFRDRCGDEAWSVSGPSEGRLARVYTDAAEITAMAYLREKADGVGDVCVLTDPSFRGERRGAAVVSAVTRDALAKGYLVLYQTLEANRAAVRLALSLGFARYGNHLAVRLKHDAPPVSFGSGPRDESGGRRSRVRRGRRNGLSNVVEAVEADVIPRRAARVGAGARDHRPRRRRCGCGVRKGDPDARGGVTA